MRVLINGKASPQPVIYIDDVKKSLEDVKSLPLLSVGRMNVDKADGKDIIRIYTKQ